MTTSTMIDRETELLRPALRGAMHRASVPVAICLTVLLAVRAPTGGQRAAAIIYGVCVVAMLTVSGIYHLPSLFVVAIAGCCAGSTTRRSSWPSPARTPR